jgi:tetratricopeptide (TPR) repeat protein
MPTSEEHLKNVIENYSQALISLEQNLHSLELNDKTLCHVRSCCRGFRYRPKTDLQKQAAAQRKALVTHWKRELETQQQKVQEEVLKTLHARDNVEFSLCCSKENSLIEPSKLKKLADADFQLKTYCKRYSRKLAKIFLDLDKQKSLAKFKDAWWWNPEHPRDRLDGLWDLLTAGSVVLGLAFTANIAPRFWVGEPSAVGAFAVLGSTVLSLLIGKEALDPSRMTQFLKKRLENWGFPSFNHSEIIVGIAVLFAFFTGSISFFFLDDIAECYYKKVPESRWWELRATSENENNLKRSLAFSPDHEGANLRLGFLYELQGDLEDARKYYKTAAQNGSSPAIYRLAGLYLMDEGKDAEKSVNAAATVLNRFKENIKNEKDRESWKISMAWARLRQKRYDEASQAIGDALNLHKENYFTRSPQSFTTDIPTTVYCVQAEILYRQFDENLKNKQTQQTAKENSKKSKEFQEVLFWWDRCSRCASSEDPDEDFWKTKASNFLRLEEKNKDNETIKKIAEEIKKFYDEPDEPCG